MNSSALESQDLGLEITTLLLFLPHCLHGSEPAPTKWALAFVLVSVYILFVSGYLMACARLCRPQTTFESSLNTSIAP